MEKENTTKTGGEAKEGSNWEGCQCGCAAMPIPEGKSSAFMGGCGCMPEQIRAMMEDCCSGMSGADMVKMMKNFSWKDKSGA